MKETPSLVAKVTQSLRLGFLDRETQASPAQGKPGLFPLCVLGRFQHRPMMPLCTCSGPWRGHPLPYISLSGTSDPLAVHGLWSVFLGRVTLAM